MNTRRHLALICVAALAMPACGIANDAAPRDIPLQQRSALIDAPVQAPATSTGTDRIFLLAPQLPDQPSRLRATPRDVGPSIEARLNSLFGPLSVAEAQARLLTAIPEGLNLHSATLQTNGTLTIDVTDEILSLSSGALIESVAQIVFTALEVRNVQRVQLLVNGTSQQWPGGDGSLRTTALSAFDFPGLIETSQPNFPAVPSPDV